MDDVQTVLSDARGWLQREHKTLLSLTRSVEYAAELDELEGPELGRRVRELAELFSAHARDEEAKIYDRLAPQQDGVDLQALSQQHRPIIESLQAAARSCDEASGPVRQDSAVGAEVRRAVAKLRMHEADEAAAIHRLRGG